MNPKEARVRFASVLFAVLFGVALGGCVVKGPEIKVKPPIEIKAGSTGQHCPPGHAKKGQC